MAERQPRLLLEALFKPMILLRIRFYEMAGIFPTWYRLNAGPYCWHFWYSFRASCLPGACSCPLPGSWQCLLPGLWEEPQTQWRRRVSAPCLCSHSTPGFTAGGSLGTLFSGIKYWHLIKIDWKHISKSPKSSIGSSGYQTISLVLAQVIYVWFSLSELKSSHRTLFLSQPF